MRVELTRIGNSRGIRIPKPLIAECGLGDVVELRLTPEGLVIAPHRAPRQRWKQAFASAAQESTEMLLSGLPLNAFDIEGWKW